ncbi:MAG: c-type cytochrome [Sphingomonadaceae bacterium]
MKNVMLPLGVCGAALMLLSACSGAPKEDDAETAAPAAPAATTPAATNAAAPAAATVTLASLTGDAAKGATVFKQCATCHSVKEGENRVGPYLHGVVGRHSGEVAGYSYSAANKNSGLVWTADQLFTYLEAPQKTVPGTKMSFAGLKNPQDRADVIAYLKTI